LLQLLLAIARELHAFFEELHGLIQRQIRAFQLAHDLFQARQGLLKRLLFCWFGLLAWSWIHAPIPARIAAFSCTLRGRHNAWADRTGLNLQSDPSQHRP